jgi:hypothetical protein
MLHMWAHIAEEASRVALLAAETGQDKKVGGKTQVTIASGTVLSVLVEIPSPPAQAAAKPRNSFALATSASHFFNCSGVRKCSTAARSSAR